MSIHCMVSLDGESCTLSKVTDGHVAFALLCHSLYLTLREEDEQEQGPSLSGPLFSQRGLEREPERLPSATLTERA